MTKESIRIFELTQKLGKNFIYRHHIEPRSPTYVPREESFRIFKIYIIERNSSEKIFDVVVEDRRKTKTSKEKQIQLYCYFAGKGRNSVPYYSFAHEFVPMKNLESSSLNSF